MHFTVNLALDLLTSRLFMYELGDLLVYPEGVGLFNTYKPPPSYVSLDTNSTSNRRLVKVQ